MRSRAVPSLTWSRCVRVLAWYRGLSLTAGPASRCCDDSSYETVLSLFFYFLLQNHLHRRFSQFFPFCSQGCSFSVLNRLVLLLRWCVDVPKEVRMCFLMRVDVDV
jgi:hypothetical protein